MQDSLVGLVLAGVIAVAVAASGCSSSSSGGAQPSCGSSIKCTDGQTLGFCFTGGSTEGSCSTAYYTVGSQQFPCKSCSNADLAVCQKAATSACTGDAGASSKD